MPRIKTKIAEQLSCRFKFKSADVVELVIIDHTNNDAFAINWNFRSAKAPTVTHEQVAEEDSNDDE